MGTDVAIIWLKFGLRTLYAHNCEFKGTTIQESVGVSANQCSRLCESSVPCTNFTWSPPKGGTCALKSGRVSFTQDNPIPSPNFRCGYKKV